jgi:hypothetical protein
MAARQAAKPPVQLSVRVASTFALFSLRHPVYLKSIHYKNPGSYFFTLKDFHGRVALPVTANGSICSTNERELFAPGNCINKNHLVGLLK